MQPPSFESGRTGSRLAALALGLRRYRIHRNIVQQGMKYCAAHSNGITFHWYQRRRGLPALVLLHGFLDSSHTFRRMLGRLSESFDLIALDLPGFGGTRMPPIRELWHIENMTRATARFLTEHLCLRGAKVFTHSMGGMFALRMQRWFYEQHNAPLFSEMHMIAPGVLHYPPKERDAARAKLFPRTVGGVRYLLDHLYARGRPEIPNWAIGGVLYEWTQPEYFALAENTVEDQRRVFFTEAELSAYEERVVLYWGDSDGLTPVRIGRRMAKAFGDAELVVLKNSGHALHLENQDELLKAFFRRTT